MGSLCLQFSVMSLLATCVRPLDIIVFRLESLRDQFASKYLFNKSSLPVFLGQSCTEELSRPFYYGANLGEIRNLDIPVLLFIMSFWIER